MHRAGTRFRTRGFGYPWHVPVFEMEIPARPSEVGRVRRAIRAAVVRYGLDASHADLAQLLASELVMNAVLHGRAPVVVRVSVDRDSTILEVYDADDTLPVFTSRDARSGGDHRGLRVVANLASDFGTIPAAAGGKTVWCAIPHAAPPRASGAMPPKRRADDVSS
jgi:anti-sigma regulatory factor (Ser/Thr protein kinase)